jgi:SAM-dependent methyltransferase
MKQTYIFDNAWTEERRRLDALEAMWDPYSRRNLTAVGVSRGWRCLDVGAGGGSVATWLHGVVGSEGHVVATDIDVRHLEALERPGLEMRRHDIVSDDLEHEAYDLVHARLLLEHLPQRDVALRRMYAVLKPGGWLVLEEFDHVTLLPDPACGPRRLALWDAWLRAFERLAQQRKLDLSYGRRLAGLLYGLGLEDVLAEGWTTIERGGNESRALLRLSIEKLRDDLIATGEIDSAEVDELVEALRDPHFSWTSQLMVAARGRRTSR